MSSILNALKKLEQETAPKSNASLPQVKQPHPGRSKILIGLGLIAVSLCIGIGAGILIFGRGPAGTETARPIISETKQVPIGEVPSTNEEVQSIKSPHGKELTDVAEQKKPAAAAPKFEFSTAAPVSPEIRQADAGQGGLNSSITTSDDTPDTPPVTVSDSDPFASIASTPEGHAKSLQPFTETEDNEDTAETAAAVQPETSIRQTSSPDQVRPRIPREPVITRNEPPVDVINDPAMELQAISWSADPNKRMAIINGKICREKDPVAGYVIDVINSGDVIISKGSVKGRLVFEIR